VDLAQACSLGLFDAVLKDLRDLYDYLLFDGGSLEACPDSLLAASRVDGAMLVVQAERTGTEVLREASDSLRKAGANLLGVVLNRRRQYVPGFIARRL
jgi:Mrp family chromosome partitioning ATPase